MSRIFTALVVALGLSVVLGAQGRPPAPSPAVGSIVVPASSVVRPQDRGIRAHTNHIIFIRSQKGSNSGHGHGGGGNPPPPSTPQGETPSSIAAVYNLPALKGANTIVIVDAYDYPTAENDLNVFSSEFGLPACTTANGCFSVVYASGKQPRSNCGWAQEESLDIEWAHAMAPDAKIVLVEAASNSFANLFAAVDVASAIPGAREVSMSWGGSEFSGESAYDSHFATPGIVYFAASGDTGGQTIYPSASPFVVAAGGTTIHRNSSGVFTGETGWSGSGGGPSLYESRPGYQDVIQSIVGNQRGVPDLSFDADPASGVSVYDSTSCQGLSGWLVFGGTSVASPSLAGLVNSAGTFATSSQAELNLVYGNYPSSYGSPYTEFRDITSGTAGSYSATADWDFVTGIGSVLGLSGK